MFYKVRRNDTPASIAARFGRAGDWQALVLTNRRLGLVELPVRSQLGRKRYTFKTGGGFVVGAKLVIPPAWINTKTRGLVGVGGLLDWFDDDEGGGGGGGADGGPGDTGTDITGGSGGDPGTGGGGSSDDWTIGGYCVADFQCPAGKTCSSGQCVSSLKDNNLTDKFCGTGYHFEEGKGCVKDGAPPTCKGAAAACAKGTECCSGSCIGGVCQVIHKDDPGDGGGGAPPACKPEGTDCTSDSACCDGSCKAGKCAKKLDEPAKTDSNAGWWIAGIVAGTAVLGTSIWLGARSKKTGVASHNPISGMITHRMSLRELQRKPTLAVGQADDLKYDKGGIRVWLSRVSRADGARYNNAVTIEKYNRRDGRWETVDEYEAL